MRPAYTLHHSLQPLNRQGVRGGLQDERPTFTLNPKARNIPMEDCKIYVLFPTMIPDCSNVRLY